MFGHYISFAFKGFRRRPGATLIKIFALALGLSCFVGAYMVSDYFDRTDSQWANSSRIYAIQQKIILPGSTADIPTLPAELAAGREISAARLPEARRRRAGRLV